jgi:hypothetical protein
MTNAEDNNYKENIDLLYPGLLNAYTRLKGIGGFISILGPDPRVRIFCRYNHVQRVVMVSDFLVSKLGIDKSQCITFLSYFHDINRLPLSYVSEKALDYNQAQNLRPFLRKCKDFVPEKYIGSLEAVMNKKTDGSFDVRFVYLADMFVNFIEDIMFTAILLGISPDCLPGDVLAATGLDDNEREFGNDIEYLRLYFTNADKRFTGFFQETILKYINCFIDRLGGLQIFLSGIPVEKSQAVLTVKRFLSEIVFPIIDEKIVKEKLLIQKVVFPYYNTLLKAKTNPYDKLWNITDQQLLEEAAGMGLIKHGDIREFWPELESSELIFQKH